MHNVGYHVIRGHKDVCMIQEQIFVGPEFQTLLENCHIKDACTSTKNPQATAVCESEGMHQTVGNVLRTFLHGEPPQNITTAK
jgi:hypothetical protein